MTDVTFCVGIIICFFNPPEPVIVNNFAQECRVIMPSRSDTPGTLAQINKENARCLEARKRAGIR